ncbi:class I SAM-dependent RNA methyltransferase [Paenalkalicoccus suaedae]|uniref:Class I SAM-dependent RNA methyltransferase n=1 Tax=Paenalkalicoccus suaedae TaxID=2592382 RepID=A0A859FF28_9BACI|nr:class I SAM-dependent RNA methyltransferase [Paenalkalicoccus suaedae]QKS71302.1 class I SAM-dependent RNA methyltransferase [Paenalkalicoccus suaedae]
MTTYTLMATATMGLEAIVGKEVKDLGFENVRVENGRVLFDSDMRGIAKANMWLRTADRVKLIVGQFRATTFEDLFEQTKALPWSEFISEDAEFPVLGRSVKSTLFSISDCQAIVKKAIVESLKQTYNISWFQETGAKTTIEVALLKDVATITIDTSGDALHKRGYRELHNKAPLKETMAAAMIQLTNWKPDMPFYDLFCGSGTIPIEAAMIGQNIAPGSNRSFDFEKWHWFDRALHASVLEEAEDLAKYDQPLDIHGSDNDRTMISLAQKNAMEAGFPDQISFTQLKAQDFRTTKWQGVIVSNPPYGERLEERDTVEVLYKELGKALKSLDHWSIYLITSHPTFENLFGRKATKNRKLYNGNIKTHYYQYFGKRLPRN